MKQNARQPCVMIKFNYTTDEIFVVVRRANNESRIHKGPLIRARSQDYANVMKILVLGRCFCEGIRH